ncbi:MAG: thermonuclease family protein [archaeon]
MKKTLIAIFSIVFVLSMLFFGGGIQENFYEENTDYEKETEYGIVERVIDGDTAEIMINGEVETVRFLGVDAPELRLQNDPEEYRGITDEDCLYLWAEKATNYTKKEIGEKEVKLVYDSKAGRKGVYGRTLAYIELGERDFTKELIEEGYARIYDNSNFIRKLDYLEAEATAYNEQRGLWRCS